MIPDYQTLMRPVLEAARQEPRKISDVVSEISDKYALSEEERRQMLPSGTQTTIANRVHWARSYLKQAGLVKNIRRGWFELTERGHGVLGDPNIEVNTRFLQQFSEFQEFLIRTKNDTASDSANDDQTAESTPDENLEAAHERLNAELAANLLDAVRNASPQFFETLIVNLLLAMGYGGSSKEAGRALGQSGDNGVDGVIDQDPLGVDQIYLQAKRYAANNQIGSHHIRDFFGALNIKKASKGIFVTTSSFTTGAQQTRQDLGARIVLIDGQQLARLMIRHNVGCRDVKVLHIKEIDEAFFDPQQ